MEDARNAWSLRKQAALVALGKIEYLTGLQTQLAEQELGVAAMHRVVSRAAENLWQAGHFRSAVVEAAIAVNRFLQHRLGRRDLSDFALVTQALSMDPPRPGQPRLRMPGDRTGQTWKSRQQGAMWFGQGCFAALRNPAAHDDDELSELDTLERLAAWSLLARWIEEADVESIS